MWYGCKGATFISKAVTVAKDAAKEAKVYTTAYEVIFCACFMCKRLGLEVQLVRRSFFLCVEFFNLL
jgi:hypothetical protein